MGKLYCKFDELDKLECKFDELAKLESKFDELDKLRMSSMRGMCIKRLFWPAYEVKK